MVSVVSPKQWSMPETVSNGQHESVSDNVKRSRCAKASFGRLLSQICLPAIACMFTVDDIALLESKKPKSRVSLFAKSSFEMPKAVFACKFFFRFERIRVKIRPLAGVPGISLSFVSWPLIRRRPCQITFSQVAQALPQKEAAVRMQQIPDAPCMDYLPTLGEKWLHSRGNVGKYSLHGAVGNVEVLFLPSSVPPCRG